MIPALFTTGITRFTSFLHTHMFKARTITIGLPVTLAIVFGVMLLRRPAVQVAEAGPPPEAITIADSLRKDIAEYAEGDALETRGHSMKVRAVAAAKGKDLTLCADFQLRLDRATGKLVADEQCPLL